MPAAEETVLAHLVKLRQEGTAKESGGVWTLGNPHAG
jgi:beta-lactamase-like protein